MYWYTFWEIFSQTGLVTLAVTLCNSVLSRETPATVSKYSFARFFVPWLAVTFDRSVIASSGMAPRKNAENQVAEFRNAEKNYWECRPILTATKKFRRPGCKFTLRCLQFEFWHFVTQHLSLDILSLDILLLDFLSLDILLLDILSLNILLLDI
jgi:hypothetical protein